MLWPENFKGLLCWLGFFEFRKVIARRLKSGGPRKIIGTLIVIDDDL